MKISLSLSLIFIIINSVVPSKATVIECSQDLERNSPYFMDPGAEPFSYTVLEASNDRGFWMAYGKFRCMEHHGTFVVAPYSLYEFGQTVDQIPLENLFGEACVINIRDKVLLNDTYELTAQDVRNWVTINGAFVNNSFVLIYTGWDVGRYPDQLKYFGDDKGIADYKFPGVSMEAMQQMLSYQTSDGINIIAFGIDTPRISNGAIFNYTVGGLSSSLNKYGIRNMMNLDQLPAKGANLTVAPMKIKNGAGSPARVFAFLPN